MEIKHVNDYVEREFAQQRERQEYFKKLDNDRSKKQLMYNHTTQDLAIQKRSQLEQWVGKRE